MDLGERMRTYRVVAGMTQAIAGHAVASVTERYCLRKHVDELVKWVNMLP